MSSIQVIHTEQSKSALVYSCFIEAMSLSINLSLQQCL